MFAVVQNRSLPLKIYPLSPVADVMHQRKSCSTAETISFVGHIIQQILSSTHPPLQPPQRPGGATPSTTVLKLSHTGHCTPKKCHPKFALLSPQSLHRTSTTRARSGGMGCKRMSRALANLAALVDSSESTVFLHIGHRPSYRARLRKQLTCIA